MNASMLAGVEMAPRDPILGITEAFNADTNPAKVNLGVGVYCDDNGKLPVLQCVRLAEQKMMETAQPRNYLPIDGLPAYNQAVQGVVFGAASAAVREKRVVTAQTLGGTGALKVAGDFLRRFNSGAELWISNPSWENHRAVFESAGFKVNTYPYYDAATNGLNFAGMLDAFKTMPSGSICLLHACCHNPTGVDLSVEQWKELAKVVADRGLVPLLDMAYQGFAESLEADAYAVRLFADTCPALFVASSFSKSLSLYGERVGALSIVAQSTEEAGRVQSQLKRVIRTNYSSPPTHGGQAASSVLMSADLRTMWDTELGEMRERIKLMRHTLVDKLHALHPDKDFSFVTKQRGMFSYSGLTADQVKRLREEYSIYAIDSGRICVAALNSRNIDNAAKAIAVVMK